MEALKKLSSLPTPFERNLLDELCQRRDLFEPLPAQIFQLREQEDWNKANFLLKTVASRLGEQLTWLLDAMVEDQRRLLELDNQELVHDVRRFILILLLLSMLGIGFTIWLGFKIDKRSVAEQKAIAHQANLIEKNSSRHCSGVVH